MKEYLSTSESVSEGHPDKLADQIADAILDACIKEDKNSKVACEILISGKKIIVAGEITTSASLQDQLSEIITDVVKGVGYIDPSHGLDYKDCQVETLLRQQSPDISMGVIHEASSDFFGPPIGSKTGRAS